MTDFERVFQSVKPYGFGAMRLPLLSGAADDIDVKQVGQMADHFLAHGFTYFDTAYGYHNSKSEGAIKAALVDRHPRDSFLLADKMPVWTVKEYADYEARFQTQLGRCGVDYFDCYLLHSLNKSSYAETDRLGGFEYMKSIKKDGRAKFIGFSFHDSAEVLDEILTKHPEVEFVQLQLNYIDWDSDNVQSGACYEVARRHGVPIIVMEPVKGGALSVLTEDARKVLLALDPNASVASYAMRFCGSLEGVAMVLGGASSIEQITDNCATMEHFRPLTGTERAAIEQVRGILKGVESIPCTSCNYCMENCPQNIAISEIFGLINEWRQFESPSHAKNRYFWITQDKGSASSCIECGVCEARCPQKLEISRLLKEIVPVVEA